MGTVGLEGSAGGETAITWKVVAASTAYDPATFRSFLPFFSPGGGGGCVAYHAIISASHRWAAARVFSFLGAVPLIRHDVRSL